MLVLFLLSFLDVSNVRLDYGLGIVLNQGASEPQFERHIQGREPALRQCNYSFIHLFSVTAWMCPWKTLVTFLSCSCEWSVCLALCVYEVW